MARQHCLKLIKLRMTFLKNTNYQKEKESVWLVYHISSKVKVLVQGSLLCMSALLCLLGNSGKCTVPKTSGFVYQEIPSFLSGRFEVLNEENSPMILDIEEERRKQTTQIDSGSIEENEDWEEFKGVDLERGLHGVFDAEQLVELLQCDGALDVCVIKLPVELKYAEHLVIVTGRSARHRKALAQLVRRVYKKKCLQTESIPRIEGAHADGTNFDWLAMDLGNIVLHIFARSAREKYDLESLWALGSEHDVQCVKPDDPLIALLNSHSVYLGDLEPAEPNMVTADSENTKT
ncbi:hypothetical protein B566_EDAN009265 [Ephemera danica]|nr:hypothetical protein B566_EDAN009265 [Ephemera danica]